jgi:hypothetical protein
VGNGLDGLLAIRTDPWTSAGKGSKQPGQGNWPERAEPPHLSLGIREETTRDATRHVLLTASPNANASELVSPELIALVGTGNATQAINSISTISFSLLLLFYSCPLLAHKQFLVGTVAAFFSQSCPIQPEKDILDTASSFFFLTPTPSCNGDLDLLRPIILKGPAPLGFRNRAVATRDPLPIQLDVLKQPSRNLGSDQPVFELSSSAQLSFSTGWAQMYREWQIRP